VPVCAALDEASAYGFRLLTSDFATGRTLF
jgi:hypothetical protein